MGDLKNGLIAAGCVSMPSEPQPVKISDKRGMNTEKPKPEPVVDKHTTGNFTIHFEVDHQTFGILEALSRHRGETTNSVAANVVKAWVANTWRNIEQGR